MKFDRQDQIYMDIYNENLDLLYNILEENTLLESINSENECFIFFDELGKIRNLKATMKHTDKVVSNKIDNNWQNMVKDLKRFTIGDERENIITGRSKMSSLIKKLLGTGVLAAINPIIAAVSAVTFLIVKHKITKREKLRLLREMDSELAIVEEKIRDAESDGNKKAKYSLMRLKNRLIRDMERIKYCSTI